MVRPLWALCARRHAAAAPTGARVDLALSAYPLSAGRIQLPSFADLLGLCGRSDRSLWTMGRWMDGAGAAVALSAVGNLGNRQRPADAAFRRAMVSAVAVWTLARRQRSLIWAHPFASHSARHDAILHGTEAASA